MSVAPELLDAVGDLLQPLLETLERVVWVQRHLYPPQAQHLARELAPCREEVSGPLQALGAQDWPLDLHFMRDRLAGASRQTVELVGAFVEASNHRRGPSVSTELSAASRPCRRLSIPSRPSSTR